ncbi:hypothetical protein D3C84_1144460 [compost metagenome]
MGEQIEALKDHADVPTLASDVALGVAHQTAVGALAVPHGATVDANATTLNIFQQIDATNDGGLA